MKPELKEKLKELSKDKQSFEQLRRLYDELDEEKMSLKNVFVFWKLLYRTIMIQFLSRNYS